MDYLKDILHYYKRGKYKRVILIINGLVPYQESEPLGIENIREAMYLNKALKIKETPEIREKLNRILNGIRNEVQLKLY